MIGELYVGTGPARPGHIAGARNLYTLRLWSIWRFLKKQSASYWLICSYLFFEYVRPQSIYESVDLLPWAFLSIVLCLVAVLVERRWWRFGIEMTMFLPISVCFIVALRRYWSKRKLALLILLPTTSVIGMLASSSRGALLGGAAVLIWFLMRSRHRVRTLIGTAAVVVAAVVLLPNQQKERLTSMGTDPTSVIRLTYWKDGIKIANENPVLGIGYANWADYYRRYYNPRGKLSHKIFVQAGAELGYTGLLGCGLLIASPLVVNSRSRKIARQLPAGGFLLGLANG